MRFSLPLLVLAALGVATATPIAREEATTPFGTVSVEPTTVGFNEVCSLRRSCDLILTGGQQQFIVTYNSTESAVHPDFVDTYIQETLANGQKEPFYLLLRSSYPSIATSLAAAFTVRVRRPIYLLGLGH